jgi:hypothetical protein
MEKNKTTTENNRNELKHSVPHGMNVPIGDAAKILGVSRSTLMCINLRNI